jgi:hypothetical protein
MSTMHEDPFVSARPASLEDEAIKSRSGAERPPGDDRAAAAPSVGRLHGFGWDEGPLVVGLGETPEEIVPARSTVALRCDEIGAEVLVIYERNDLRRPIIVGVLRDRAASSMADAIVSPTVAQLDGERVVLEAEREVVLRCGAASITLTRAGKVIIKGTDLLSRSSGYNRLKGAAVDIN